MEESANTHVSGDSAEVAAHQILKLIANMPGAIGRLRAARIIGGFEIPFSEETPPEMLEQYSIDLGWPLREYAALVDAMIGGGLITQTSGARPTLVLTRAGFMALVALESGALA